MSYREHEATEAVSSIVLETMRMSINKGTVLEYVATLEPLLKANPELDQAVNMVARFAAFNLNGDNKTKGTAFYTGAVLAIPAAEAVLGSGLNQISEKDIVIPSPSLSAPPINDPDARLAFAHYVLERSAEAYYQFAQPYHSFVERHEDVLGGDDIDAAGIVRKGFGFMILQAQYSKAKAIERIKQQATDAEFTALMLENGF